MHKEMNRKRHARGSSVRSPYCRIYSTATHNTCLLPVFLQTQQGAHFRTKSTGVPPTWLTSPVDQPSAKPSDRISAKTVHFIKALERLLRGEAVADSICIAVSSHTLSTDDVSEFLRSTPAAATVINAYMRLLQRSRHSQKSLIASADSGALPAASDLTGCRFILLPRFQKQWSLLAIDLKKRVLLFSAMAFGRF